MDSKPKHKSCIHSPKPKFKCSFCKYKTHRQTSLYNHIRTHTKERPYKCPQQDCNSSFTEKSSLSLHQLVHKKDDESLYKFRCSKCPYKTMFNKNFKQHSKTHSDVKEFSCDLCPYQAKIKEYITRHKQIVHLKLKPFKCPQPNCNYACSQTSHLNQHQMVHKDKNDESLYTFKCTKCPYKSFRKNHLTKHLTVHSEVKQFGCDLCPFRAKNKGSLKTHEKNIHLKLKSIKCPQPGCNFFCKNSSDLASHEKVHVDDKPLSCSFPSCSFTTKWKISLNRHEMMHRGERPFKCSLCPKNFRHSNHLHCHIRGHTGETPYPCPRCPYRAKSSPTLKKHLKTCKLKTNGEVAVKKGCNAPKTVVFECKVARCDFLTEQNSSMAIHYNNIHNLPRVDITKMGV